MKNLKVDLTKEFQFPKGASRTTTGVFFPDDHHLITGHENGVVFLWDLQNGKSQKIFECPSKITTISSSKSGKLVIGSHSGHIAVCSLDNLECNMVQKSVGVKHRVWRSLWIRNDMFITSSTYGVLNLFTQDSDSKWKKSILSEHSDSVFAMGISENGLLITADYSGKIIVWNSKDGIFKPLQRLKIQGPVEAVGWYNDEVFVAINYNGRIYQFEQNSEDHNWQSVSEVTNATSLGKCINISQDGKTVFGGTNTEVIQFDTETQLVDSIEIPQVRNVFTDDNNVFILTSYGLFSFKRKPVEFRDDLIKYKYIKTGIIGYTGVGKSTLCSIVSTGSPGDFISTVGKSVWNWELPSNEIKRKIVFHDHGGQETVLSTFIPFLSTSDIILILFQQNDLYTFNKALEIFNKLKDNIADRVKIFFVQTHIDEKMSELNENVIKDFMEEGKILGNMKVCPKDGRGIEELKERLLKEISWKNARTMIQTKNADAVLECVTKLQEEDTRIISVKDFIKYYEENTGLKISGRHLEFLLQDYSNQGIIEYYPEILDKIIFNEPEYNSLKTHIPIYVMKRNGIVTKGELTKAFENSRFLPMLDTVYLKYKIALENGELRIFPELLRNKSITIPKHLIKFLEKKSTEELFLPDQIIGIDRLIEALSELRLQCIDASKKDGLFAWKENALVYYSFERIGNAIDGFAIHCNFTVGGMKKQLYTKLKEEFLSLVERLYGPILDKKIVEPKKKVNLKNETVHDVAISYASEQLEYAEKVANIIRENGRDVFFDLWYEEKMWGRDLSKYLMDKYYRESRYCMMFISKDYVSKAWPTYERKMAVARNIEEFGGYILPIRFDKSEVPGLSPTVRYVNGIETSPERVADLFLKKIEEEEKID